MYNKNSLCICVTVERKLKGQDRKQSPETNVQHLQDTSAQLEVKSLLQKDFQFSALLCEGIYHCQNGTISLSTPYRAMKSPNIFL